MYVVDTNVLVWILRNKSEYIDWFDQEVDKTILSISTITVAEIYKNLFPSELISTEEWLGRFQILTVTGKIAKQAGLYWQQFSKKNLNLLDCLIAATAKINFAKLVTLNTKHFPMSDVEILKPL
jgi:predicted nucleic acid-binding protein